MQKETDAGSDWRKLFLATPATPGGGCGTPVRAGNNPVRDVVWLDYDIDTHRDEKEKAFIYIEKSVRTKPRISASLQELYSVNILVFICFPRRANVTANNKKEKKKPN